MLSGEAGIGKSRLTAALLETLKGEPVVRLRYFCSPEHADSAFYPIIGQMTRRAGLAREDDPKTKLDKLDKLLAISTTTSEEASLVADMLSLPSDGRYPELDLIPRLRRQKTMEALTGRIEVVSRDLPILMIVEDAHWADPSTLEAFRRVIDKIASQRVLLVVTSRLEFGAPWPRRPEVTALPINRLAPDAVLTLIDHVAAGGRPLADTIRQDILDRSDCVPLFVEEITRAVMEAESEGAASPAARSAGPRRSRFPPACTLR